MNRTLRKILILFGALSLLALPLSAAAEEGTEGGDPEPAEEPAFVFGFDSLTKILIYGFDDGTGDPLDCSFPDPDGGGGDALASADEPAPADGDGTDLTVPPGCTPVDVAGPNDQVNHGSIVSAFVHSLKDGWSGGGIGKYVREIGGSDFGKKDNAEGGDGTDGELLGTEAAGGPKPKKGKKNR